MSSVSIDIPLLPEWGARPGEDFYRSRYPLGCWLVTSGEGETKFFNKARVRGFGGRKNPSFREKTRVRGCGISIVVRMRSRSNRLWYRCLSYDALLPVREIATGRSLLQRLVRGAHPTYRVDPTIHLVFSRWIACLGREGRVCVSGDRVGSFSLVRRSRCWRSTCPGGLTAAGAPAFAGQDRGWT